MARYTITPWKRPSDLLTARQQLYRLDNGPSPSTQAQGQDLRRHAVDRIMAWKLRSNLPHAIESTALLIDAQLHHQNATAHNTPGLEISEFSIRAVYAAAFTRFVTGFCDIGRSRERGGLEQSSMLAIARQIGMPADFVSLRHEVTHEELPGLRRLVGAVGKALEWLWTVYWARLDEENSEMDEGGDVRPEIVGLLKIFRRERRDALRSGVRASGDELVQRTAEGCLSLFNTKRAATRPIVEVLVSERLLLPTNRKLGDSIDGAYMIWDDMLSELNDRIPVSLGTTLVEALLAAIAAPTDARPQGDTAKEAYALWVLHLSSTLAGDQADKVMQLCCLHPGHWTQLIGQRMLEEGDDLLRETWEDVVSASLLSGKDAQGGGEKAMQTAAANQMDVEMAVEVEGKWERAVVPSSLPIGVVG